MTLSAYLNNGLFDTWIDLSDKIDYSSKPQITTRIDDAFASGSVKVWFNRSTPIPPYTPFYVNGQCFVGKSTVSRYLSESGVYIHDISLLEATAFLKTLIIGTKVYSAESPTWGVDYKKFMSLVSIAGVLYDYYSFSISPSHPLTEAYLSNFITTSKTYTFGAKDTLYDCLNQICLENNLKLKVSFNDIDPTMWDIDVERVPKNTFYTIPSSIIGDVQDQDAENYGRYLETYASNVVDKNTLTHCEFITPSNDNDVALNADNAVIKLPTMVNDVVEFGTHQLHDIRFIISNLSNYFADVASELSADITYGELASTKSCTIDGQTVYIFENIYNVYLAKYFPYVTKTFFYNTARVANAFNTDNGQMWVSIPTTCNGKFPMACLQEKSEWEMRTPQDQTECLFYTIGGKTIENLNATYKNDLWNVIIGQSRENFLHYNNQSPVTTYLGLTLEMYSWIANNTNIFAYMYWCDYHAITNPILQDDKEDDGDLIISNEFAPISRSYGNSDNFIDFDKLIPNMHISNQTLGRVERTLQLDLTNEVTYPAAGQKVTISGSTRYISTVIFEYSMDMVTATITLVANYNKKADSIGVDSQTESTNNPLKNITTRPIRRTTTTSTPIDGIISQCWYMRFKFYDTAGNLITNTDPNSNDAQVSSLITRCSVQASGDTVLFYCEMFDQIVFSFSRGINTTNYWYQNAFRYTTAAAECGYYEVELGQMDSTTAAYPMLLPVGTNSSFRSVFTFSRKRIDKDAREKLTFSIRMNYTNVR